MNQRISEWRQFTKGCEQDNHKAVVERFRQFGVIFVVADDHHTGMAAYCCCCGIKINLGQFLKSFVDSCKIRNMGLCKTIEDKLGLIKTVIQRLPALLDLPEAVCSTCLIVVCININSVGVA